MIFGRHADSHAYDGAVAEWRDPVNAASEEEAALRNAVGVNVIHDHRVTSEREAAFDNYVDLSTGTPKGESLERSLVDYFETEGRYTTAPGNSLADCGRTQDELSSGALPGS